VVAVLGYEEHYVPNRSEVKLSDTGPPRAARQQPSSLPRRSAQPPRDTLLSALSRLACTHARARRPHATPVSTPIRWEDDAQPVTERPREPARDAEAPSSLGLGPRRLRHPGLLPRARGGPRRAVGRGNTPTNTPMRGELSGRGNGIIQRDLEVTADPKVVKTGSQCCEGVSILLRASSASRALPAPASRPLRRPSSTLKRLRSRAPGARSWRRG
jgi:hypothetical protein